MKRATRFREVNRDRAALRVLGDTKRWGATARLPPFFMFKIFSTIVCHFAGLFCALLFAAGRESGGTPNRAVRAGTAGFVVPAGPSRPGRGKLRPGHLHSGLASGQWFSRQTSSGLFAWLPAGSCRQLIRPGLSPWGRPRRSSEHCHSPGFHPLPSAHRFAPKHAWRPSGVH